MDDPEPDEEDSCDGHAIKKVVTASVVASDYLRSTTTRPINKI